MLIGAQSNWTPPLLEAIATGVLSLTSYHQHPIPSILLMAQLRHGAPSTGYYGSIGVGRGGTPYVARRGRALPRPSSPGGGLRRSTAGAQRTRRTF